MSNTVPVGPKFGFRENTRIQTWSITFVFNDGGMGDFINYTVATLWMAKNCPWIEGRIFAPRYFVELCREIHKDCRGWLVWPSEEFQQRKEIGSTLVGPSIAVGKQGLQISQQLLTCLGAHPIDVGFAYYAETSPPPNGQVLPVLDFEKPEGLPDKYIVIPCGFSAESRSIGGRELNPIIDHIVSLGIKPVFLGKGDLLLDGKTTTKFVADVNYHKGLDLRDKTTVIEAAAIMQHAECTVGLDMGLLHLAALMKDSKIVFGYNITTPEHRRPRRHHGETIDLFITKDELSCIACQSTIKKIPRHTFDKCFYGDKKCIDLLFKNQSEMWKSAINELVTPRSIYSAASSVSLTL